MTPPVPAAGRATGSAAAPGQDPVIALPTLLHRVAAEQARLASLVLALQDILSPHDGGAVYGSESIRGLQSVDLVTQSLNDLARLTHAMAACAEDMAREVRGREQGTCGDCGARVSPGWADVSATALVFDIRPLREILTLGDLAERVLGTGGTPLSEDDSDIVWLDELAATSRQEGAA